MRISHVVSAARATVVVLFCTLLVPVAPAAAPSGDAGESQESSSKETKKKPEQGAPTKQLSPFVKAMGNRNAAVPAKTYSNEDLEKMFAGMGETTPDTPPVVTPPVAPTGDEGEAAEPPKSPLDEYQAQEKAREEHRAKIADAEKRVAGAEQRIAQLERDALAQRNPYLPRPTPPEDEKERAAWERADGKGRAAMIDQQLQAAREALAKAREELAALRGSAP